MLTPKGWLVALIFASLIFILLDPIYILFPIVFLLLGSLVSSLNKREKEYSSQRNAWQVIANGGCAALCLIFLLISDYKTFIFLFVASYAIALSDTFSSEIGVRYGGQPIDILRLKKLQKGLSGGISLIGSFGGILGAGIIGTLYYLITKQPSNSILIIAMGVSGMIVDSILGSLLQAKYLHNGNIKEEGPREQICSGVHWMNNDMVNFLSNGITLIIFFSLLH